MLLCFFTESLNTSKTLAILGFAFFVVSENSKRGLSSCKYYQLAREVSKKKSFYYRMLGSFNIKITCFSKSYRKSSGAFKFDEAENKVFDKINQYKKKTKNEKTTSFSIKFFLVV